MEPFLRNDQFNFIKEHVWKFAHAHATVKDADVIHALKYSAFDQIINTFYSMNEEQEELLKKILYVEDSSQAEQILTELKAYVISFPAVTAERIKKLFPKVKKLTMPPLEEKNLRNISYLGWNDVRSERKYIITTDQRRLTGVFGTFRSSPGKGICTICNKHEETGLFMAVVKAGKETYTSRGNYICQDSSRCNQNITDIRQLETFMYHLKK
ncbi:elongation factor G-binding protein [Marinococcus halophilus]|nr:elongation factor G-binding protein [Marinococcus halophilus]